MTSITHHVVQEAIKVTVSVIGAAEFKAVNARELHSFLQIGRDFSTWIVEMITVFGFVQDIDYSKVSRTPIPGSGNRGAAIDYFLTLDMAKELSMVQRNDRGREARRYFIECERRTHANVGAPDLTTPKELRELADRIEAMTNAKSANAIADRDYIEYVATCNVAGLAIAAAILRQGAFQFVHWLGTNNYITPSVLGGARVSAEYEFAGLFHAKDLDTPTGWMRQLYVTQKGFEHFRERLTEAGHMPPLTMPMTVKEMTIAAHGGPALIPASGNKGKAKGSRT